MHGLVHLLPRTACAPLRSSCCKGWGAWPAQQQPCIPLFRLSSAQEHLRQLMREVVSDPSAARRKGAAARAHIIEHFSLLAVGRQLLAQLLRVQGVVSEMMQTPFAVPMRAV